MIESYDVKAFMEAMQNIISNSSQSSQPRLRLLLHQASRSRYVLSPPLHRDRLSPQDRNASCGSEPVHFVPDPPLGSESDGLTLFGIRAIATIRYCLRHHIHRRYVEI